MVAAEDALLEQADQLIVEAATSVRTLSPNELQLVLDHIAQAGFEPTPNVRAGPAGGRDSLAGQDSQQQKYIFCGMSGLRWSGPHT